MPIKLRWIVTKGRYSGTIRRSSSRLSRPRSFPVPTTIPQIADARRHILTDLAAATERSSGFVQRRSKLTGPLFAQTLVFGWWAAPTATLEDLVLTAATLGGDLSPQALDQRFTPAATFLYGLLHATLQVIVAADPAPLSLLRRFA